MGFPCGGCGECNDCKERCPDAIVSLVSEGDFVTRLEKIAEGDCGTTRVIGVDVEIVSPDNTIGIKKEGNMFELTTDCCENIDEKVSVSPTDTAGFLIDKLASCDENKLTIEKQVNIDGTETLVFCIQGDDIDEKVRYKQGCDAVFGEELTESKDDSVKIDKNGCKDSFYLNPQHFCKPFVKRYMSSDYIVQKSPGGASAIEQQGRFYSTFDQAITDPCNEMGASIQQFDLLGLTVNTGTVTIPKTGYYQVSLEGSFDVNYGVNAARQILFATVAPYILIDSKYGETMGCPMNTTADYYTGINEGGMKQYEAGGVATYLLPAGAVIFAGGRMDNSVGNNPLTGANWAGAGQDGVLVMRHAGLAGGALVQNNQLEPMAGYKFEVKRDSNLNGDMRYIDAV